MVTLVAVLYFNRLPELASKETPDKDPPNDAGPALPLQKPKKPSFSDTCLVTEWGNGS